MDFRLIYRGTLKTNADSAEKHRLRKELSKQLQILWDQPPLTGYRSFLDFPAKPGGVSVVTVIGDFKFAPLISTQNHLLAGIDILLLQPREPGNLIVGGDIDNRLKTLFHAFRAPKEAKEIPEKEVPNRDGEPIYCLLEDDRLITSVRVTVDRLLEPGAHDNEVLLIMHITLKTSKAIIATLGLV